MEELLELFKKYLKKKGYATHVIAYFEEFIKWVKNENTLSR